MAEKIKELRALIYGKFNSETEMAKSLGWSRQRLNKITTGIKTPDLWELRDLSNELKTPISTMAQIFLNYKSPNRQQQSNRRGVSR